MRTYYQLLSVAPAASAEAIKSAFRREIARYHPDKVQHLGPEFQEIASTRAAELTEAYRVLMDPVERQKYDETLEGDTPRHRPAAPPAPEPASPQARTSPARPHTNEAERMDTPLPQSVREARDTISEFVRKATAARLRAAVEAELTDAHGLPVPGFDLAVSSKGKRGLFTKHEPPVRLLARILHSVDCSAIEEVWPVALKALASNIDVCVLLLGQNVASAKELGAVIAEQRRKSRNSGPIIVPVDFRDWQALVPPETPASVRGIIDRLKHSQ